MSLADSLVVAVVCSLGTVTPFYEQCKGLSIKCYGDNDDKGSAWETEE